MQDIAQVAGLSHVAVSLALRKHRSIPPTTRERILEIARQIGYRPDPTLSALMVYRRNVKPSGYQATLAFVNCHFRPKVKSETLVDHYFQGALERCLELGYRLEEFRLAEFDLKMERLSRILRARNIPGLLISPHRRDRAHLSRLFDWQNYSAVSFGFSLAWPKLHVVTNAQFGASVQAIRRLRALGYRRIGYVTTKQFEQRTDRNFMGGYLVEQRRLDLADHIPPFVQGEAGEPDLADWVKKWKPEAIWDVNSGMARQMWAAQKRGGCALALGALGDEDTGLAGIDQDSRLIGRTAVDTVVAMIHAQERGIPKAPKRILVEGRWRDGPSAPRITRDRRTP
jgi:DNA-binding LacI/PurR family transcriptional regulator